MAKGGSLIKISFLCVHLAFLRLLCQFVKCLESFLFFSHSFIPSQPLALSLTLSLHQLIYLSCALFVSFYLLTTTLHYSNFERKQTKLINPLSPPYFSSLFFLPNSLLTSVAPVFSLAFIRFCVSRLIAWTWFELRWKQKRWIYHIHLTLLLYLLALLIPAHFLLLLLLARLMNEWYLVFYPLSCPTAHSKSTQIHSYTNFRCLLLSFHLPLPCRRLG